MRKAPGEHRLGETIEYVENRYFTDYVRTTRAVVRASDRRVLSERRTTEPERVFLPDWEWRYRYDGPVLREAWFDYGTRPTVGYCYDYDDRDRVRTIERYQLEESDLGPGGSTEVRAYDADGRLGERTTYDRFGRVLSADEYRYDDFGNRTFHAEYGVGRQLQSRVRSEYRYDTRGNWTSRVEYHTDNLRQEYDVVKRIVTRALRY